MYTFYISAHTYEVDDYENNIIGYRNLKTNLKSALLKKQLSTMHRALSAWILRLNQTQNKPANYAAPHVHFIAASEADKLRFHWFMI